MLLMKVISVQYLSLSADDVTLYVIDPKMNQTCSTEPFL